MSGPVWVLGVGVEAPCKDRQRGDGGRPGKAVERGQAGGRRRARRTGKQAEGRGGTALGGIFVAPGRWLWGCTALGKMALYRAKWLCIGEKWLCIGQNGSISGKNGSISGKNGSVLSKMAPYWRKMALHSAKCLCIGAKWLYIGEKWLCIWQNGSILGKMALHWAKWLYIGEKWLCIGQNGSILGKTALYWG